MTKTNGERLDIDFLANLYKEAKKQYKAPNTSILLAQVILESALGTSDLALKTNNLAGIKASPPYTGKPYFHSSPEEISGVVQNETSGFRQYDSIEDFVVDHVKFFTSTPTRVNVYKDAYTLPSSQEQADALTGPGKYATDSRYSSKLMNVINQYNLTKYDNETNEKEVENTMVQLRTPKDKITLVNTFGRHTNTPKYIVIHYVGAVGQAAANANYFYNVVRNASAHIFIDKNETWRVGYDDMAMWHVGDAASGVNSRYNGYKTPGGATNRNTLSIEMCQEIIPGVSLFDCPIHENTIVQTLLQTQKWMKQYNIPADRVIRHYDVSGKLCPAPWRHDNWALWSTFKKRLSNLSAGQAITSGTTTNTNNADTDWGTYRKPAEPFKPLKVGDKVTIRKGHQYWYINTTNKKRKVSKDFAGDKDVIIKVMDVNVSYSKKAYLLKNKVSWILEQDLVEARTVVTEDFDTYKVVKGDSLWIISQKFNVTVEQIKQWNQLDSNLIKIGQELFVQKPTHTGAETPKPEEEKKPDTTVDIDGIEESEKQPVDNGEKTPALKLKENQILTADGRILEFTDVTNTVKK